jgi:hypothetical protein
MNCTVCGCRFQPSSVKQLVCWDCVEDNSWRDPKPMPTSLGEICKCPICGRSHIKLERS